MKKFDLSYNDIKKGPKKSNSSQKSTSSKGKSSKNKAKSTSNYSSSTRNKPFLKRLKSTLKSKRFKRNVLKVGLICIGLGLVSVIGIFAYFSKDLPSPNRINDRNVVESTKIYDRTGDTLLYEIHGEAKRTLVSLDQVVDYSEKATIAAEDKDFYKHFGFDPKGIARSVFLNVQSDNRVGGSTITQQFVKNSILTSEKTYTRKIKELILAVEIELKFTKEEILQMYLNEIPYGSNAYGIEAASETFFEKSANELTLAEAALLASLPQRPTYYSPYGNHQEDLKLRQEWILDRMAEDGYITQDEADSAKEDELAYAEEKEGIIAPHFVLYVRDKLTEKYGDKFIQEGGLKVYTTLDYEMQLKAEQAVLAGVERNYSQGASNAALVAIDPKTGQILAMQGSKDYFDKENDGNVNVAIRDRQPGSSFKPYAYAKAFEKGYTPDTILFDLETDFSSDYRPRNYDLSQNGPVTIKKALAGSLNIPAVKTLYLAGLEDTMDFAKKLGINTLNDPDRYGLSLVLGGGEIKLLEHAAAFSVFANDGLKYEKTAILKIIDKEGKTLENNEQREGEQVVDQQVARQISGILSDNGERSYVFGSSNDLVLSRPAAAKTGTTQEYRDAWTVGFTPNLAAGVWVGNNDNATMSQGAGGIKLAAPIWNGFMEDALQGMDVEEFQTADRVDTKKAILNGKTAQETKVTICMPSEKLATERCPEDMKEERSYRKVHSILYYVDKNNPQGAIPSNPASDPQFSKWEGPVRAWAEGQGYKDEEPPTEYDDMHEAKNEPSIQITSPKEKEAITDSPDTIVVTTSAPLGIKKVEFFLDGALIGADLTGPYQQSFDATKYENGSHVITARIYDIVGNRKEDKVNIEIDISRPPSITLSSPSNGISLAKSNFPQTVSAQVSASNGVDNVKFYAENIGTDGDGLLKRIEPSSASQTNFSTSWSYPGSGTYTVYAVILDDDGKSAYTGRATVVVE
ncbi:MAG: PBP1A family penicillin-binding protein [Parcubacteria group bacterium]|nr:PBP1A family penicillin-binding protein [Parcubacteria group bacterium]